MSRKPRTITDADIADLRPKRKRLTIPDSDQRGLYIRVMTSGVRSFCVVERGPGGKQVWTTLGRTQDLTIEAARAAAATIIKRVRAGLPPVEPPPPAPQTLAAVADNWLARYVVVNKLRSERLIRSRLAIMLPVLGQRDFATIRRSDIAALLDHVQDKHGARSADQCVTVFSSLAAWFASRNDDYTSPLVRGVRMKRDTATPRDRVLDDDEVRAVWAAAGEAGTFGAVIRLCLLTAQRRSKVFEMKWSDVDDSGVWHIPQAPREKDAGGSLALSAMALDVIRAQPRFASNPHVFAGARGAHIGGSVGHLKPAFDKRLPPDMPGWTLHDLRRTARTLMSRAGVDRDTAERVLGHAVGNQITQTYDRHKYDIEKGKALEALAAMIARILAGPADNVVPLHA
jgi:integrase